MARLPDPGECPFCGGEAKVWTRTSFDRRVGRYTERTTVLCRECGCRTMAFEDPRDAVEAWNTRFVDGRRVAPRRPWWRWLVWWR